MRISGTRWFAMALIAGMGASVSSLALAHVDVGVDIGVPGVVYAPQPVYVAPPPEYAPPPPPQAAIVIAPGWYGDRYYDGHRYWERRDWEARHHDERNWREARDYHGGYDHHDYDHHDGQRDGWRPDHDDHGDH
jgi:hypothetical protein